jgi:hypothetical protein
MTADPSLSGVHIRCCGNGGLGFRPYGDSLFLTNASKKVSKKKARPGVRPLAGARCSFVPAFIWGHRLRSASLRPPLDVCGFAARRYAPVPQMNASTQPAEGAGRSKARSRSRAAGELTLGLLSGEERAVRLDFFMIVPTLCVGMPPGTLRVPLLKVTQSVTGCITTRSVGTIKKSKPKKARPDVRPLASVRCSFAPAFSLPKGRVDQKHDLHHCRNQVDRQAASFGFCSTRDFERLSFRSQIHESVQAS